MFVDPRLLHLLHVQAAKLQWSLDEKLGSSGGTRVRPSLCVCVSVCLCVCVCVCRCVFVCVCVFAVV